MRKILITGGAGFIGSSLADELIKDPENYVVIADNLLTGDKRKLPSADFTNWKYIEADVNYRDEITSIMTSFQFDYIFHYAAMVGVLKTLNDPIGVLRDIDGFKNILETAKNTAVKRVYFSSSSEVYGEPVEFPQNEKTTPLNSRLPYAIVKNVGEAFLRSYHQKYGLEFTILRFFNTYGPKQSKNFVISKFLYAALNNQDITIYGDGSQTRTFCYIDDNINVSLAIFKERLFVNDVVNIGNDNEIPIIDLAKIILKLTDSKSKIVFLPPLSEGDMTRRLPDINKMKPLLKNQLIPLEEGIKKILEIGLLENKPF
ncbi:MAG: NAD-dependent epimerase/dehydratase family protein [Bacteroidales bacterium]|nr:NAD-dependent epimerase/dehydratase family protein [Bacteroidales bacterium]